MKVVYQTCCGVDVHKSVLVATIIKTTSGVEPSYQKKRLYVFFCREKLKGWSRIMGFSLFVFC